MNARKIIRLLLISMAIVFLICDVYIVAYYHGSGHTTLSSELLGAECFLTFLMGVMILISGLLIEKEKSKEQQKRLTIYLGLFFALSSILCLLFVLPMLPPSGH